VSGCARGRAQPARGASRGSGQYRHAMDWAAQLPEATRAGARESSEALARLLACGRMPDFLQLARIESNAQWCSLEAQATAACVAIADRICRLPAERPLLEVAWHLWRLLFPSGGAQIQTEYGPTPAAALEDLTLPMLGADTATLLLLLALGGVPSLLARHKARGVPEHVTRASLSDIAVWARAHHSGGLNPLALRGSSEDTSAQPAIWGLSNLTWPMRSLTGELLRVGRLQHRLDTYNQPFRVYRERSSGLVTVVCAEAGLPFTTAGLRWAPRDSAATTEVAVEEEMERGGRGGGGEDSLY